jgi:threonine dehydratase
MSIPNSLAVAEAADRLAGVAHLTPVFTSRGLDERAGLQVFLKCESFQRCGAFKFRGAYNALSCLEPSQRDAGVVTHSSGNHGQAVALAAKLMGIRAVVVMPEGASAVKKGAALAYGARIVTCPPAERETTAARLVAEHGYTFVHPYDDDAVIAGQGTAAKELFEQVGELDLLVVPVGGGGLISGSALAASTLSPSCRVVGVEPERAADAGRSFREGRIHTLGAVPDTIADGLRTRYIGVRNLAVMLRYVSEMTTASEEAILEATVFMWQRLKIVVEPSAAVALAPLLAGEYGGKAGRKAGVIVSGGNVDPEILGKLGEASSSSRCGPS